MNDQQVYRRRRRLSAFAPFLAAVVEIVVFVLVAQWIGLGWAILLMIGSSLAGLWLMRRAGFRAWRSLRAAASDVGLGGDGHAQDQTGITTGQAREERIADAGVTLLAGTVLLLPGFVSDAIALLLMTPPVRKKAGRRLAAAALRTFPVAGPRRSGYRSAGPDVIEGEVVGDAETNDPPRRDDTSG
ncbi:FxsA family protein [Phytoactinopolyspora alkaliphila]|uniref:FxsA family protein n=1 Tax=Phytoactinopolyspora alkaliphila TaxID=1783498 RepID=A0A6N9YGS0_9ACTN|nr:FxsA family protein [Phytoactinopolyspora alkaliphila]NED94251.1 FxsA family protein [Phytoactinopolyspora alkaliphila]